MKKKSRHILSLSGGKDSAALAIYLKDKIQDMEYVFCDTFKELPETYEYLNRLEAFLGKKIIRLSDDRGFDHWLTIFNGYLPSPKMRWCTRLLKLVPFEKYVGNDYVYNYIGIRFDENREGYISHNNNIIPKYPFKEDGITKNDVIRILEESGIGLPKYYSWRTRSGCFFCFFQRRIEWVGLFENHPDLFNKACKYESEHSDGRSYTWIDGENLQQLLKQKRLHQIKDNHQKALKRFKQKKSNRSLYEVFTVEDDNEFMPEPCLICTL